MIAKGLTADGIPTARGAKWTPSAVWKALRSAELDAETAKIRAAA